MCALCSRIRAFLSLLVNVVCGGALSWPFSLLSFLFFLSLFVLLSPFVFLFSVSHLARLGLACSSSRLVSSPSRRILLYLSLYFPINFLENGNQIISNPKLFSKPEASQRIEDNWCIQPNTSVQGCSVLVREDSTSKRVNFVS